MKKNKVKQNKDKKTNERKQKFEEVKKQIDDGNLPLDKLSMSQLKTLCSHKKQKSDKVSISKLKQNELLPLWLSWKDREEEVQNDEVMVPEVCNESDDSNMNHDSVINHHNELDDNVMNVTII